MTQYGKIVCGALVVPQNYPDYIEVNGQKIVNPTEKQLSEAGYLPISTKKPSTKTGKVAVPKYSVSSDGTKINQSWTYEDIPEPMTEE